MNRFNNLFNSMEQQGLLLNENPMLDGEIHRYSCHGNKGKDEWYVGHELDDGNYLVVYGSWRVSDAHHCVFKSWDEELVGERDNAYREALKASMEKLRIQREKRQEDALQNAIGVWESSVPASEFHQYLVKKKVKVWGIKEWEDKLLIPVFDSQDMEMISLQSITIDGEKRFFPGCTIKRGCFVFGELEGDVYVAEGYATAASVFEATGKCTVCAFCASNMVPVGLNIQDKPDVKNVHLLQDLGGAGEKVAEQWKAMDLGEIFVPDFGDDNNTSDNDFNDLAVKYGYEEVCRQVFESRMPKMTVSEFLKKNISDPEYVIKDMIPTDSVSVVFGGAGVGKSWLCYDLAMGVATGRMISNNIVCTKRSVAYIDAEMSPSEMSYRWNLINAKWSTLLDRDVSDELTIIPIQYYLQEGVIKGNVNILTRRGRKFVENIIKDHDVIFIDNYDTMCRRKSDSDNFREDENSWRDVLNWLYSLSLRSKAVIFVMHANKGGVLRGTGKITDDANTVIQLSALIPEVLEHKESIGFLLTMLKGRSTRNREMSIPFGMEMVPFNEVSYGEYPWKTYSLKYLRSIAPKDSSFNQKKNDSIIR